jgi:molybdenum ABC transporter molybdate-binding protein
MLTGCSKPIQENLFFYCAAGMKPAVSEIVKEYQKQYNVKIDIQYGGSGTLLANLRVAKKGDLYLAGDSSYIDTAQEYNLIDEVQEVAYLTPVIGVRKGNPQQIKVLRDLLKSGLRIAIGNPDAASIGRQSKKILSQVGMWDGVQQNIQVLKPTVNELANDLKLGTIDAAVIWDATGKQYPEIENVIVPEFEKHKKRVTVAVLKTCKNPTVALSFLRYLSASDKGLSVFKKLGYIPVDGDPWEEVPELLFYSGGVNRVAIDNTLNAFEKREGVRINRIYNGCGILVSQIKAGQRPDVYLTCDTTFLDQVEDLFYDIEDISSTKIIIAVQKDNPSNLKTLEDLTGKGFKLGVCNPKQSALGHLTAEMLKSMQLYERIMRNVVSQTPTADLLVNQLRTGSLDAVIVYEANVSQVKDYITYIYIEDPRASATQNYGFGHTSKYRYLTKRLMKVLSSSDSRVEYEKQGFDWKYIEH